MKNNSNEYLHEIDNDSLNIDDMEKYLEKELNNSFQELKELEDNRNTIGNPDNLGKVVLEEIWNQFGNQIGMDLTNETLIQKYDKENPESYKEIKDKPMRDINYQNKNKEMKTKFEDGNLIDAYTGKDLKYGRDKINLDHTIPRKEIYEDKRRKQANLKVEDLANRDSNLAPTNESLNKSKGAKSNKEYINKRSQREESLKNNYDKALEKIDKQNISDIDKKKLKEKKEKALQDKLDANDELMMKQDKKARKNYNKEVAVGVVKNTSSKAAKDALKTLAITALFDLLKDIINGLIRFLKQKSKSLSVFIDEMKNSLKNFISKFKKYLKNASSTFISTIVSEMFGPIVSMFKKMASLIKQGISSFIEIIAYLKNKENKDKPLSIKIAQVGKILTTLLVGGSAIYLGEIFEKILLTMPVFAIQIPVLGTIANIVGLFLSSLLSGIVGAIILNMIDKFISKKLKAENQVSTLQKGNTIINLQNSYKNIAKQNLYNTKKDNYESINELKTYSDKVVYSTLDDILNKPGYEVSLIETIDNIENDIQNSSLSKIQKELKDLL
ncbi:hypothetical protein [Mammaliicoccus sciuri]|uniref:hypothetical protein n=1 Tax=Mammaliicoccus sciuri TaxID=1296 RepID=UPI003F55B082